MEDYKVFETKRKTKQYLFSLIFVLILIFGWQYPWLGFFIPLCMILGLAIGLARGRKWCDWYCPRGSFYDALTTPLSKKKAIPQLFKNIYFRLSVLVVLMGIMIINLVLRWPHLTRIGLMFVILLTVTTTLGVILTIIFHPRSWCTICPIGTVINLIGGSKVPLTINSDLCVECKLCSKVCPIQIKPYLYKTRGAQLVKERDCLKCASCVAVCPKRALTFQL